VNSEARGRLHIEWPAGCGRAETYLVAGEVIAGWVDNINALRAENAWLRELLSRAMFALHGATTALDEVAASADGATYSIEAVNIRTAMGAGPPADAP
jgi:hypothetical protein